MLDTPLQRLQASLPRDPGYFHGNAPGLKAGDRLLPAATTGTDRLTSNQGAHRPSCDPELLYRRQHVYFTPDPAFAIMYAALYPDGALYQVRPAKPVEPDEDELIPGQAWKCPSAIVTRVIAPRVPLPTLRISVDQIEILFGINTVMSEKTLDLLDARGLLVPLGQGATAEQFATSLWGRWGTVTVTTGGRFPEIQLTVQPLRLS